MSKKFEAVNSPVQRHKLVYASLADQLQSTGGSGTVHALSIVAKTPKQWASMMERNNGAIEPSPKCRGGDGSLASRR